MNTPPIAYVWLDEIYCYECGLACIVRGIRKAKRLYASDVEDGVTCCNCEEEIKKD